MKKNIPLLILLLFIVNGHANAKYIAETDAVKIVEDIQVKKGTRLRSGGISVAENSNKNYYVINDHCNGGYYFVSASDKMGNMILGHAINGEYEEETINKIPALKNLLSTYSEHIEMLESKQTFLRSGETPDNVCFGEEIKPFMETQWDQKYPYNLQSPEGSVTGCVATAMAQVLKYYGFPTTLNKEIPSYKSYDITMEALSPTTFDYNLMLDQYSIDPDNSADSEESKEEVAKLMKYCGRAIEMQYAEESGSNLVKACKELKDLFGFSNKVKHIRNCITLGKSPSQLYNKTTWGMMLYNELAHKRPIIMASFNYYNGNGHAYVCCGYSWEEGFYYNWGWNGYGDGYYQMPSHFEKLSEKGFLFEEAIMGIEPSNPVKLNGSDLEFSDMDIKSTYVKYDLCTVEMKVKNVGQKVFSDYFMLSSNEIINSIESKTITLNPGEEDTLKFNYGIFGAQDELIFEITTPDGVLIADSTIKLGQYNHDYTKIECNIMESLEESMLIVNNSSSDGPYFPKLHGNRTWPLYVQITNNSDTTFRDLVLTKLFLHDSTYTDTVRFNDDTYLEIPPYETFETYVYLKSQPKENYCPISILYVGNYLHTMAEFFFEDCYEISYKNAQGLEQTLNSNSNKIPNSAVYVDLYDFSLDSLDISNANPNCLFYCSSLNRVPCNLDRNVVINDSSEYISISASTSFKCFNPIFADSVEFSIDLDLGDDGYMYKVLYLPFSPQFAYSNDGNEIFKSGNMEIFELKGIDDDENISFSSTNRIEENKIYLLKVPASKAKGLNSVRFVANKASIAPSQDILIELKNNDLFESNAILASSTEGYLVDKSNYMTSYSFDPSTKTFRMSESLFSDLHPFEGYLVDNPGFTEDYNVIFTTEVENIIQSREEWVNIYLPNGVYKGSFLMKNGYIKDLPNGIYVSKGRKCIQKK